MENGKFLAEGSNMKEFKRFSTEAFRKEYHYDRPLGASCSPKGTRIDLWAPTAEAVFLHLYPKGNDCKASETISMERGKKGVWSYTTTRNLDRWYYDFDVTVGGKT